MIKTLLHLITFTGTSQLLTMLTLNCFSHLLFTELIFVSKYFQGLAYSFAPHSPFPGLQFSSVAFSTPAGLCRISNPAFSCIVFSASPEIYWPIYGKVLMTEVGLPVCSDRNEAGCCCRRDGRLTLRVMSGALRAAAQRSSSKDPLLDISSSPSASSSVICDGQFDSSASAALFHVATSQIRPDISCMTCSHQQLKSHDVLKH